MARSRIVLALDLGSKLGWAIFHGKRRHASGMIEFKRRTRNKIKEPRAVKYVQFLDTLRESYAEGEPLPLVRPPDLIVYEHARGTWIRDTAREVFCAMLGQLEIFAMETGTPLVGIPPKSIKKAGTGRGNASKEDMVKAARKIWRGIKLASDDEADALHTGRAYVEGFYP